LIYSRLDLQQRRLHHLKPKAEEAASSRLDNLSSLRAFGELSLDLCTDGRRNPKPPVLGMSLTADSSSAASEPSRCQLFNLPNLHLLSHTPQQPLRSKSIGDGGAV
jgi:hypothetical protein